MALVYSTSIVVGSLTYSETISSPAPVAVETETSIVTVVQPPEQQVQTLANFVGSVDDIPGVLCSWWASNESLKSLTYDGMLWYPEAPVGVITPYAIMFLISATVAAKTTKYTTCHDMYQISVYADQKDDAMALGLAAAVWFDRKKVYQSGDDLIQTQTGDVRLELAKGLGLNGADAWMGFFEVEVFYKV